MPWISASRVADRVPGRMAGKPTQEKTERRRRREIERLIDLMPKEGLLKAARKIDPTVTGATSPDALRKIVVDAVRNR